MHNSNVVEAFLKLSETEESYIVAPSILYQILTYKAQVTRVTRLKFCQVTRR
jgi:hypothetical protein